MLSDLPSVFPAVTQLQMIVEESEQISQNRLSCIPAGVPVLTPDQAIAICSYTFDLGYNSLTTDERQLVYLFICLWLHFYSGGSMLGTQPPVSMGYPAFILNSAIIGRFALSL